NEAELDIATAHFVGERGGESRTGRAEGMADRDGAAHHIGPIPVYLSYRSLATEPLRPGLRAPGLHIGQYLRRECLVDFDKAQLFPGDSRTIEGFGHRPHRTHQQL